MPQPVVLPNVNSKFNLFRSSKLFFNIFAFVDRWQRSQGMALRESITELISPESVRDNWNQICDFENDPMYPESSQEMTVFFAKALNDMREAAEKTGGDSSTANLSPVVRPLLFLHQIKRFG